MGWNDMIALQTGLIQQQQALEAEKKAAAEAAQSQYLQSMLKQYGFSDPLEVKQGLWDKVTPWQTDSEKARPYAEQLLQNSALAVDQDWYNQNVVPNQTTTTLKIFDQAKDAAPVQPDYQSMYQMPAQRQAPVIQPMSNPGFQGATQQNNKTNTEKFLEYLKQSAGAKL